MKAKSSIALLAVLFLGVLPLADVQPETNDVPLRVLFVGNSYTALIKRTLGQMLAGSPYKDSTFEFLAKGRASLSTHLTDVRTMERIRRGRWDFVVLQDQSQKPALPGNSAKSFHASVDAFTKAIRDAGAEPVLFMTWGRRDGDPANKKLFPDYVTMQLRLYQSYSAAANRNRILLAPVGDVWAIVRQSDDALGKSLYNRDGSHPSAKGAYLASSVLFQTLFQAPINPVGTQSIMSESERGIIDDAVASVVAAQD